MDISELVEKLKSLMVLDIDAISSYDTAISKLVDGDLRTEVISVREDHKRHVNSLEALIISLGGTPPERRTDIRGIFLGGATILQSITGTEGALKALQSGEKLTNKDYGEAVTWTIASEIKAILEKNYHDEQRHLRFVNNVISDRVWEKRV